MPARRATIGLAVGLAVALGVAGCGAPGSPPTPSRSVSTSAPPASSSSPTDPGPTPGPVTGEPATIQTPEPDAPVRWGQGEDPPGGDIGIPRYAGWYRHAIGAPTSEKVIYLTLDDGPAGAYTEELLRIFVKNDAVATWFMLGEQANVMPALVGKLRKAGQAIGNHSWNHTNLNTLTDAQVRAQLEATNRAVGPAMGTCMRPPYGLINSRAAAIAESMHQVPVLWTGHATDWSSPPVAQMVATFKSFTKPGAVILMHDGGGARANTVEAMRRYVPWLRRQGYTMAAVPSCLGSLPAQETKGPVRIP